MADIRHSILIDAPSEKVRPLFSSAAGFSRWWAADTAQSENDGSVELGFFSRNTVYRLRPSKNAPNEVVWKCDSGKEWNGTELRFLSESSGTSTLVRFVHGNWQEETDYFVSCNTTWGALMYRLKAVAEGKSVGPLFTTDGQAY